MKSGEAIIALLNGAKDGLCSRYPIKRLGLFGSNARGDAGAESDIDIMIEFSAPVGMEIVDLAIELEKLLGQKVDLVSRKAIKPRMWPYIEKDIIYV